MRWRGERAPCSHTMGVPEPVSSYPSSVPLTAIFAMAHPFLFRREFTSPPNPLSLRGEGDTMLAILTPGGDLKLGLLRNAGVLAGDDAPGAVSAPPHVARQSGRH